MGSMIAETIKWLVYLGIPAMFLYFAYSRFPAVRNLIDPLIGKKLKQNTQQPQQPVNQSNSPTQQPAPSPQGTHYREVYVLKKIRIVDDDEQPPA